MILQSLKELAAREHLLENPDYEPKPVAWIIALDKTGRFLDVISTVTEVVPKKKPVAKTMSIPRRRGRTSGSAADFIVDKSEYVLGVLPKSPGEQIDARLAERLDERQQLFTEEIRKAQDSIGHLALDAALSFLKSKTERTQCVQKLDALGFASNDLLAIEVDGILLQDIPAVQSYFSETRNAPGENAEQCLLCGSHRTSVDKHHSFQLRGGTSSGIPLVTVNKDAFESYGWSRSENAPVCRNCADAYATALKRLLSDRYPDPVRDGEILPKRAVGLSNDTTAVFWAEVENDILDLFADLFNQPDANAVERLLTAPFKGSAPANPANRFFCLVLTGAQGRATVRSMHTGLLPQIEENVRRYFQALVSISEQPTPIYFLLRSLAVQDKADNLDPSLASDLFLAILFGRPFPRAVLAAACTRCRAEQKVTRQRAMLLSAYFQSRKDETGKGMGLNTRESDPGYRLGRLLAVLERLQSEAQGKPNKTIVDRYYGAASTRPATVFPSLLGLSIHHAAKLQSAGFYQRQLGEVLDGLERFPATLTLEQQGMFALGYFHQRQNYFKKADAANSADIQEQGSEEKE